MESCASVKLKWGVSSWTTKGLSNASLGTGFSSTTRAYAGRSRTGYSHAQGMRARVRQLDIGWRQRGYRLGFGICIAQGYATLGAIGFEGRWDYAAIGTVTNLAARLCGEARERPRRLPRGRAPHLWNASGQERVCDGCDEKIDPQDKAVWGIAVRDWGVLYLHATCYELWEAERLTLPT